EQVIEELRPKLDAIADMRTYLSNPPLVNIGGRMARSLYQFTMQGPDVQELYRSAADFEKRMRTIPGLVDVSSDLLISTPQVDVDIDRERASALGITADEIESALYNAYGARQVSTIYTSTNDYAVILELAPKYQRDPRSLDLLYLRTNSGGLA